MAYSIMMPPLCLASYQGNLAEVKSIIQTLGAPDQTTLDDYFSEEPLERNLRPRFLRRMTPLFAAVLMKHSSVVEYLIQNGEDVSAGTQEFDSADSIGGLSPLHAAFLELPTLSSTQMAQQLGIIQLLVKSGANPSALSSTGLPIWMMGWTALYQDELDLNSIEWPSPNLEALALLIELGMSVTQPCSYLGRTLLHHLVGPVRIDDVNFIDVLISKGADPTVSDKEGITPIVLAAIGTNCMPNIPVIENLLKRDDIPITKKIEALEMAAAVLLGREENGEYHEHILNFLARANSFRTKENLPLTPEISFDGRVVEPKRRPSELITQSILMRFSILSSKSWGAVYRHLWIRIQKHYYLYLEDVFFYTQEHQFANLLEILWTMLETIIRYDQGEEGIWSTTHQVIEWLKFALNTLREKTSFDPSFYPKSLKKSMILISGTHLTTQDDGCYYGDRINDYMKYVFEVISMLAQLPSDQMGQDVLNSLRTIVSKNGRTWEGGETLLLIACSASIPQPQDLATIRLLLEAGADPSAVNENGYGALHLLADAKYWDNSEEVIDAMGSLLLEYQAQHPRVANDCSKTAVDIWRSRRRKEGDHRADGEENLPSWLKETVPNM